MGPVITNASRVRLPARTIIIALLAATPAAFPASKAAGRQAGADGNTPTATSFADHPAWTLKFEPAAWYASLGGDFRMPGTAGSSQSKFDFRSFDLDEPTWAPLGTVHVQAGRWRFSAGGFAFSTDDNQATVSESGGLGRLMFAAGDTARSSVDFWSLEFQAAYRLVHEPLGVMQDGRPRLVFGLEPVVGVRMYSVDAQVSAVTGASAGTSTSHDDFFFEPTAGIRLDGEFAEQFTIDVQTGFGIGPWGDTESFSWDMLVGGTWRPIPNLGVRIGYKHLLFDLKSGDGSEKFEFDGSLAGLFVGVEVRF
ncbi:MAG: hypothetical protein KF787_10785 [Phycisphaeraceae bacterium]|nr:hypothetical protein [Phycisphaerae bacterium]MBX3393120.1 hypothetical protein [Phycisphaeraceae bacterium]